MVDTSAKQFLKFSQYTMNFDEDRYKTRQL